MIRTASALLVIALMGAVVGGVGAASHRAYPWIGIAACLLMVVMASVFARTWRGFVGLSVFAALWAVVTVAFATVGPGGSLLIVQDALGLTWVFGGAIAIAIVALVPRRVLEGGQG